MSALEMRGPSIDPDRWRQIEALATELNPDQTLWLSGYFAGLSDAARRRSA